MQRLRQEHGAEFSSANEADPNWAVLFGAGAQEAVQVHGAGDSFGSMERSELSVPLYPIVPRGRYPSWWQIDRALARLPERLGCAKPRHGIKFLAF